jgi:hypothetical protein
LLVSAGPREQRVNRGPHTARHDGIVKFHRLRLKLWRRLVDWASGDCSPEESVMKIVKAICVIAAAGLFTSGAAAQDMHRQTTTTRTVTRVHVDHASTMGVHHGRRMAWGHHRVCHTTWRHHHRVRICRSMPMHHTMVRTRVVTRTH